MLQTLTHGHSNETIGAIITDLLGTIKINPEAAAALQTLQNEHSVEAIKNKIICCK